MLAPFVNKKLLYICKFKMMYKYVYMIKALLYFRIDIGFIL